MISFEMSDDGTEVLAIVKGRCTALKGGEAIRAGRVLKRMGQQAKAAWERSQRLAKRMTLTDADELRGHAKP